MWKEENNFDFEQIWPNPYELAIVSCIHWDETLWLEVIKWLKREVVRNVTYITANNKAQQNSVRYIEFDLNRCFVDTSNWIWTYENRLSYELHNFLRKFSYIIDLHSTFFNVPWYFIIDKVEKINLPILNWTSIINNVYMLDWLKWTLISQYDNAIAIEIWHNNEQKSIDIIIKTILEIIKNLYTWVKYSKNIFTWNWKLFRDDIFKFESWIKDFSFIKKWEIIWYDKKWIPIFTKEDTYLLWVNFDDDDILCHRLKKY